MFEADFVRLFISQFEICLKAILLKQASENSKRIETLTTERETNVTDTQN